MSDHEIIEWCNKWDLLTKVQKRLLTLLEESPRVGNYSDIVKFCGINVNNQTANMKQIKKLVDWGIITISDFEEKDKLELKHQIGIAINSRTKTFRLCEDWFNAVSDLECNKIIENKVK
jgi:predicted transcriptional regulator